MALKQMSRKGYGEVLTQYKQI